MLKIYNTLSNKIEDFIPINGKEVKMYGCGITVYDECHIGHASQAIFFDMMRNYLQYLGYKVTYVRNFTDVDDKIIKKSIDTNKTAIEVSEYYIQDALNDLKNIGLLPADYQPKVTEHISDIINYISVLIEKGYAYEKNGEVLFNVIKFNGYGKLSNQNINELISGDISDNKANPQDFSLWKPTKPGEISWNSPWGEGRPGWHIECSVMAHKYLGEELDIHGGGRDLIFPHHENEIAQSEGYSGKQFVKYWIHNGLINIDGHKMSKSLGNFITIKNIIEKYNPEILKYAILSNNYSSDVNISRDLFINASKRIYFFYKNLNVIDIIINNGDQEDIELNKDEILGIADRFKSFFESSMNNNFNTSQTIGYLAILFNELLPLLNKKNISKAGLIYVKKIISETIGIVFGLLKEDPKKYLEDFKINFLKKIGLTEQYIEKMISERNLYKEQKNYIMADKIRNELVNIGISLNDSSMGTYWDLIIE